MALSSSGTILLSDIQSEFGGSNPVLLSEYYRGGSYSGANLSYSNYSSGMSGNSISKVGSSGSITLEDFRGSATSTIYTWSTTPVSSGYSSSNSTTFSLASVSGLSSAYRGTGSTFLVTSQLHPSTSWAYSATSYCTLALTIGTSSSLTVPAYYGKQWRMYVSYDGSDTVTIGGYYQGSNTDYPNGGAWLQGLVWTG